MLFSEEEWKKVRSHRKYSRKLKSKFKYIGYLYFDEESNELVTDCVCFMLKLDSSACFCYKAVSNTCKLMLYILKHDIDYRIIDHRAGHIDLYVNKKFVDLANMWMVMKDCISFYEFLKRGSK